MANIKISLIIRMSIIKRKKKYIYIFENNCYSVLTNGTLGKVHFL